MRYDILYYSNYCKYSQNVLQHVVKNQLVEKVSCVPIDKRQRDHQNNHIQILLENGQSIYLPPNIQNVPALLLVHKNHTVLFGDTQIIQYLKEKYGNVAETKSEILQTNGGEPNGFTFTANTSNTLCSSVGGGSEKFTNYNINPDELLSKSTSKNRDLLSYVSADHQNIGAIHAPPEDYRPNKIPQNISIEELQQLRENEILSRSGK